MEDTFTIPKWAGLHFVAPVIPGKLDHELLHSDPTGMLQPTSTRDLSRLHTLVDALQEYVDQDESMVGANGPPAMDDICTIIKECHTIDILLGSASIDTRDLRHPTDLLKGDTLSWLMQVNQVRVKVQQDISSLPDLMKIVPCLDSVLGKLKLSSGSLFEIWPFESCDLDADGYEDVWSWHNNREQLKRTIEGMVLQLKDNQDIDEETDSTISVLRDVIHDIHRAMCQLEGFIRLVRVDMLEHLHEEQWNAQMDPLVASYQETVSTLEHDMQIVDTFLAETLSVAGGGDEVVRAARLKYEAFEVKVEQVLGKNERSVAQAESVHHTAMTRAKGQQDDWEETRAVMIKKQERFGAEKLKRFMADKIEPKDKSIRKRVERAKQEANAALQSELDRSQELRERVHDEIERAKKEIAEAVEHETQRKGALDVVLAEVYALQTQQQTSQAFIYDYLMYLQFTQGVVEGIDEAVKKYCGDMVRIHGPFARALAAAMATCIDNLCTLVAASATEGRDRIKFIDRTVEMQQLPLSTCVKLNDPGAHFFSYNITELHMMRDHLTNTMTRRNAIREQCLDLTAAVEQHHQHIRDGKPLPTEVVAKLDHVRTGFNHALLVFPSRTATPHIKPSPKVQSPTLSQTSLYDHLLSLPALTIWDSADNRPPNSLPKLPNFSRDWKSWMSSADSVSSFMERLPPPMTADSSVSQPEESIFLQSMSSTTSRAEEYMQTSRACSRIYIPECFPAITTTPKYTTKKATQR